MLTADRQALGVTAGDQDVDLRGAVALDHHGRVGLITARRRSDGCTGCLIYFGVLLDARDGPDHWRWTAARPLVIAGTLKEYAGATDDQLGLEALRDRHTRPSLT